MSDLTESSLNIHNLKGMSAESIEKAYMANFFASLILLRAHSGGSIVSDTAHQDLKKYSPSMSPLNFWGMAVHNPNSSALKGSIPKGIAAELEKASARILPRRVKAIHHEISSGKVDWEEMYNSSKILMIRLNQRMYNTEVIAAGIYSWEDLTENSKSVVISKTVNYLMQCDSSSPLMSKLRELSVNNLTNAGDKADKGSTMKDFMKIFGGLYLIKKLREDEGGDAGDATSSGDVEGVPHRLFGNKIIKRKKKKFSFKKYKAPDFLKIKDDKATTSETEVKNKNKEK